MNFLEMIATTAKKIEMKVAEIKRNGVFSVKADYFKRDFLRNTEKKCISAEQKEQIIKRYKPYVKHSYLKNIPIFHNFYYEKTGKFSADYIPDNIYYTFIDYYYNDWVAAKYIDNKCLYTRLFPDVRQPEMIVSRMNGTWIMAVGGGIVPSLEKVLNILSNCEEIVIKAAAESCGGHGVFFCRGQDRDQIQRIIEKISTDIVIQKTICQHPILSRINKNSVNTIRALSLLRNNEVKVYSAVLRMGVDAARVDNASSGGITCGIRQDGQLNDFAYSANGERFDVHPTSGVRFSEIRVPAYAEVLAIVKRLHATLPHFRMISWDIAISENSEPILIEANLCDGELVFHQLNNGPLFGEDTDDILRDVFTFFRKNDVHKLKGRT